MTRLTRRSALKFGVGGVGAAGLAAGCATSEPEGYQGKVEFKHGVASGDPLQTRVVLWTRVTPETGGGAIPVRWSVSRDPTFRAIAKRGVFVTGPERDYTVKVDVEGLAPDETYYYWFSVGRTSSRSGVARTLPASGTADYRMAVVSCANWPFGYFNAYREISKRKDLHAVIHLGDYIYEYGVNGYGGEIGKQLGRNHEPPKELLTLADYRTRLAQYRTDPDLQAAHAVAPWLCSWDDHETANNSYHDGAENHQPETEGSWADRKAAAVQAYLEWMPIRDPAPGRPREAIFRKFDIGDLATLFVLESRLIARGQEITFDEVFLVADSQKQATANAVLAKLNDPNRTMLGPEQEAWLAEGLRSSVAAGKKWQVLGNQVTMAKVQMPDLEKGLDPVKYSQIAPGSKRFWGTAKYGLPWNPDSWSGFPAARERLYASARAAKAHVVTLTGDTHTAWANELRDRDGYRVGVEFGCTSITSNGAGDTIPFEDLNWLMPEANEEVVYYNAFSKGFTLLTLKADQVAAEFIKVSTVRSPDYFASSDARFIARAEPAGGMSGLQRPMGGGSITRG